MRIQRFGQVGRGRRARRSLTFVPWSYQSVKAKDFKRRCLHQLETKWSEDSRTPTNGPHPKTLLACFWAQNNFLLVREANLKLDGTTVTVSFWDGQSFFLQLEKNKVFLWYNHRVEPFLSWSTCHKGHPRCTNVINVAAVLPKHTVCV